MGRVAALDLGEKSLGICVSDEMQIIPIPVENYIFERFNLEMAFQRVVDLLEKYKDIDLILMDVHMPGISGYEVTREIRRLEIKTPIIAQTAYAMAGEEEISISEGCNDYISKPIRAQELFQLIGKYLDPDA